MTCSVCQGTKQHLCKDCMGRTMRPGRLSPVDDQALKHELLAWPFDCSPVSTGSWRIVLMLPAWPKSTRVAILDLLLRRSLSGKHGHSCPSSLKFGTY